MRARRESKRSVVWRPSPSLVLAVPMAAVQAAGRCCRRSGPGNSGPVLSWTPALANWQQAADEQPAAYGYSALPAGWPESTAG